MKRFLFILCIFSVIEWSASAWLPTDIVKQAVQQLQGSRSLSKRSDVVISDNVATRIAFMLTDLNKDGHITAYEWATYYSSLEHEDLPDLDFTTWVWVFDFQMREPNFDKNRNGMMEFTEYATI